MSKSWAIKWKPRPGAVCPYCDHKITDEPGEKHGHHNDDGTVSCFMVAEFSPKPGSRGVIYGLK